MTWRIENRASSTEFKPRYDLYVEIEKFASVKLVVDAEASMVGDFPAKSRNVLGKFGLDCSAAAGALKR